MNNQPHSFTSIPHVSNQSSHATYKFLSFYGKVLHYLEYKFGQIYILDLPLLLAQNSYLNYSYSTLMPLVKRFSF